MARLNVDGARCEAPFASELQRPDAPTADSVTEAISRTVRRLGTRGCAGRMAQGFGDHPQAAAERMRWIRQLAAGTTTGRWRVDGAASCTYANTARTSCGRRSPRRAGPSGLLASMRSRRKTANTPAPRDSHGLEPLRERAAAPSPAPPAR